jgi:glutathione peroxidase-family protein
MDTKLMQAFEDSINQDNVIRVSQDIKLLTGNGTEYLIDRNGMVIAKFYNGNLVSNMTQGNSDDTKAI